MNNFFKHLKTVHTHRKYVRKSCKKMGILWRGITHDISKYSISELKICKYYSGTRSPHQNCREEIGYSPSWMNHYHKNKHHFQYWWDEDELGKIIPVKMPYKYVIESFCDMVGAGKAYSAGKGVIWRCTDTWCYWQKCCKGKRLMNKQSEYLVEKLIWNLHELGEDYFYKWYKNTKEYLIEKYNSNEIDY